MECKAGNQAKSTKTSAEAPVLWMVPISESGGVRVGGWGLGCF